MKRRLPELTLRARLTVLVVAAVAVAVVAVSLTSWLVTQASLYRQFDAQLQAYAQVAAKSASPADALATLRTADRDGRSTDPGHGVGLTVQFVDAAGAPTGDAGEVSAFPVGAQARQVAAGAISVGSEVDRIGSDRYRVWIAARPAGGAVQVARDSEGVEHTLADLGLWELLVGLAGVLVAALIGRAVAKTALRPVDTLTAAAGEVARTQALAAEITVKGRGELAKLAESFNEMLAALATSRDEQRRLVEDAGHELRTPLASLRNNIELLIHAQTRSGLPSDDHARLLTDLDTQSAELTDLVGELVELATGDHSPEDVEDVELADVVRTAVDRARPRAPGIRFDLSTEAAESVVVRGRPAALERAVLNILGNAAKWSPPGGTVTVTLAAGPGEAHLVVTDEGPGIPDTDLPHVFERFYRAASARAQPGSGLGLAIVHQVVAQHHGRVRASNGERGGARFELALPVRGS
ncbi:HAMP domain-containing sensor histidine kinase [Amycolatopsis sp. NPDC047767]|uniref:HAMP domain-containing sensor histidine kinase n=1 Tax=Amycolatopsis sp. NPDC047767 TaxID=3156765 RepID=UPI003453A9C6